MTYDEQVTPESDPPVFEPPPPSVRLSGILAQRPVARTVVQAPLLPADGDDPAHPGHLATATPAETPELVEAAEPVLPAEPEALVEAVPPAPAAAAPQAPDVAEPEVPPAVEPDVRVAVQRDEPDPPAEPRQGRVERFCGLCDARVHVVVDDDRCPLGHKLSPAHARRRWWQRR